MLRPSGIESDLADMQLRGMDASEHAAMVSHQPFCYHAGRGAWMRHKGERSRGPMGTPSSNSSVDFPDPLHNTPELELGNADALFSQLAGDDIDRLISSDDILTPLTESDLAL